MARSKHWLGIVAIAALALMPWPAGAPAAAATAPLSATGELTDDCNGEAMLDGRRSNSIRFVVWCSTESGRFHFSLQRSDGGRANPVAPIVAFTARPATTGAGAGRAASCRLGTSWLHCLGRKSAQVTVRGRIVVPAGTRCAVKVRIDTAYLRNAGLPNGCPGSRPPRGKFDRGYMRGFRGQLGLLDGLFGDPEAIARRIDAAIRNWRRGEPVARVTAQEIGMPLLPFEQRRLEFRNELLDNMDAIEAWVTDRPTYAFAGYELVDGLRPILYVGFTGDQAAELAALKDQVKLFAPGHIEPFPVQPLYSTRRLEELGAEIFEPPLDSPLEQLVVSVSTDANALANKVTLGTQHVAKVRRLLIERFGSDDAFIVVFEHPGTFL